MRTVDALRLQVGWVLYFNEVARCRSIRGAARNLKVSPSAISRQIHELEDTLGEKLLERVPRGLRLTTAGESVAHYAAQILQNVERMRDSIGELRDLRRGNVRIAAIQATMSEFVPKLVSTFRKLHPRITFDCMFDSSNHAIQQVIDGDADISISFHSDPVPNIRHLISVAVPFGAIVTPDDPLALRASIQLHDLVDLPLVLPDKNISTRIVLDDLLRGTSLELNAVVTSSAPEFIVAAIRMGAGVGFQTPIGIEQELREKSLVFVPLVEKRLTPPALTVSVSSKRPPSVISNMVAEAVRASAAKLLDI